MSEIYYEVQYQWEHAKDKPWQAVKDGRRKTLKGGERQLKSFGDAAMAPMNYRLVKVEVVKHYDDDLRTFVESL